MPNRKMNKKKARKGTKPAMKKDILLSHAVIKPGQSIRGRLKLREELHYFDTAVASYACDTTGTIQCVNQIVQGDDTVNRTGREVVMQDISLRGFSTANSAAITPQQHRFMLVWDNAANGALAAITDVINAIDSVSYPSNANVQRFTILWDHNQVLGPNNSVTVDQTIKQFEANISLKAAVQFLAAATAIPQDGALLFITTGSAAPSGTTAGSARVALRATFHDRDN